MTSSEAKKILQLYRPGNSTDAADAEIAKALELARRDRELGGWLEEHNRFQTALQAKFREIPAPAHLKEALLAERKTIPLAWWRKPESLRVAAVIVFFVGLCALLAGLWTQSPAADAFGDYQSRMVRSALREYRMELLTNDLAQVRQLMASRGAPADFSVPKGLSRLQLTGGGVLRWRNNPVAMICYDRGDNQMLFLFVMNRSAVKDPPSAAPTFARVSKLSTVSWSEGDKTYLLAGPEQDLLKERL